MLGEQAQLLLAFAQRGLHLLPHRNIPGHFGNPGNAAPGIFDRGGSDRHGNEASILPQAQGFEMFHVFAVRNLAQNVDFFVQPVEGNQPCDQRPDYLVGGEAENHFRAVIPTGDDTF